jgi:hypothetical protein
MWLQDQAGKAQSQGKDGSGLLHLIKNQAGLTNQEEATLNAVASDWRTGDASIQSQVQTAAAARTPGNPSPSLQSLASQRRQLVLDHLTQLQAALGPGPSYLLDLFVRRTVIISGPGITAPVQ